MSKPPLPAPRWVLCLAAWLTFVVPVLLGVAHASGTPRWDEDVAVVRALGGVQVGAEGAVSTGLSALFGLVPVGSRLTRAALPSALAAGVSCWLLFGCVLHALKSRRGVGWVDLGLASFAALGTALLPSWQIESSRIGGATVSAALLIALFRLARQSPVLTPATGALLGLSVVESSWTALPALLLLVVAAACSEAPPRPRAALEFGVVVLLTIAIALAPGLLGRAHGDSDLDFSWSLRLPLGVASVSALGVAGELGVVSLALAAFGVAGSLPHDGARRHTLGWLALIVAMLIEPSPAHRLCALAAGMQLAAVGLCLAWTVLSRMQLPFAHWAGRLAFLLGLFLLLMTSEDGRRAVSRRSVTAARAWTNEAFGRLPPGTLVISDSPEIAWRLWAARVTEGTRPDILLVPSPLLGHGNVARDLLAAEPKLAGLVRDYAARGAASELSLSQLADARPLKVELSHDWDKRLLSYLTADGLWSDVAPHALGSSDRTSRFGGVGGAYRRVLRSASTEHGSDAATIDRLERDLYHHALVAATLGDRELAERILWRLSRLDPTNPDYTHLRDKLKKSPRGALDVRAMLR